ncbi:hypothetical protein KRR38_31260 [Novosphingobium sp. G106]|uniref:hypothetical protein n=1 Tax=Novosphingobium sp. G106 TaxID=2849500 RepID=UPI001C2CDB3F|nr:hypothetical protein [Novosphingobium sp. G106]MBV1692027.1 hypothetical protein [Novosphingobium sp. G106]
MLEVLGAAARIFGLLPSVKGLTAGHDRVEFELEGVVELERGGELQRSIIHGFVKDITQRGPIAADEFVEHGSDISTFADVTIER